MYLYQLSSIHNPSSAQFGHLLVDLVSSMSKNICLFINVFQESINKKWIIIRQFLLRIYNHIDFQFRNKTELSKSELSKVKLMREFFFWLWLFPGTLAEQLYWATWVCRFKPSYLLHSFFEPLYTLLRQGNHSN